MPPGYGTRMSSAPTIAPTGYWAGNTAHLHHMWSPPLAAWIAEHLHGQEYMPLYDLGCGLGSYMAALRDRGFREVTGFEGEVPAHAACDNIVTQDLTLPFRVGAPGNVICLEVAEHVPAEFEDVLLDNVANACARSLVLSWAVRGQGGDGHVNCRNNDEATERICRRGFTLLEAETRAARGVITDLPWFRDTLLVFARSASTLSQGNAGLAERQVAK